MSTATATAAPAGGFNPIRWLFTPDPSISYGFLAAVYAALAAVSLLLLGLEKLAAVASVAGLWIVPAPCALGLPYLLLLWRLAARQKAAAAAAEGKKDR